MSTTTAPTNNVKGLHSDWVRYRSGFAQLLASLLLARSPFRSWEGISILDIGCGNSYIARTFADLGAAVTGVEPSPVIVDRVSKEERNFRFIAGDGRALPFASASFDVVLLVDMLEHSIDPAAIIKEAGRVVRPGGLVYLSGTNRTSLINLITDPHYAAPFVPLMSRRVATWYITRLLRLSRTFNIYGYFFYNQITGYIRDAGMSCEFLPVFAARFDAAETSILLSHPATRALFRVPGVRRSVEGFVRSPIYDRYFGQIFNFLCRPLGSAQSAGNELRCVACRGALRESPDTLTCTQCAATYPIVNGVPHLFPTKRDF